MKIDRDSLGTRMKSYEDTARFRLTPRMPAILRADGRAFHSMTKRWKCAVPFDGMLMEAMQKTALTLCEQIQGAVFGYVQSDEISIGLIDYQNLDSQAWFDKVVQKMASVAASMATKAFNYHYWYPHNDDPDLDGLAEFDARVWALPLDEVVNYFIWRQQDATRNSVSAAARSMLSHKECQGKTGNQLQELMFQRFGVNWNAYSTACKRGVSLYRQRQEGVYDGDLVIRNPWVIDREGPVFAQDREYVERWFTVSDQAGKERRTQRSI